MTHGNAQYTADGRSGGAGRGGGLRAGVLGTGAIAGSALNCSTLAPQGPDQVLARLELFTA